MIILDTETTDLLKPEVADLAQQPHMIEIALLKLNDKWKEVDRYEALLKPGVPLDDETHKKITGLTNAELEGCPKFLELYDELVDFCLGERVIFGHNLGFDIGVLVTELRRISRETAFPYPPQQICTIERTKHIRGRRLKLTELYELKLKRPLKQQHRAMSDVEALWEVLCVMKIKV